ncbi:HD domain-containing phosphohydrolase [Fibrobacterota bacterium]
MQKKKGGSVKTGSLLTRFSVLYVGFSLVPFLLLFFIYVQYNDDGTQILFPRGQLHLIIILVGIASLLGFFGLRAILVRIVRLSETMRQSLIGKMDKDLVWELMKGEKEGELANLAKSFGEIFSRLEGNIKELEETKKTLYEVLSTVSKALSSMENFDLLVHLVLQTAIEALGAKNGAIFSLEDQGEFKLKAWIGDKGVLEGEIVKASGSFLPWVTREKEVFVLPILDKKDQDKLFAPPLVCAPLLHHEKVWGAVCLSGSKPGNNFTEDEIKLVNNLGYQIGISFENMQLNQDKERTYFETMSALALAVEAKDSYSRGHSEQVGKYAAVLGAAMGLSDKDVQTLRDASSLHDIGKIGISDSILTKPGPLNNDEREIMKKHPVIGESIVMPLKTFHHLLAPIKHHHECLDGSGYPDGLKGDQISLITRIMTVADIYDALIGDRPYRKALSLTETKKELDSLVDRGKIDKKVVDSLYRLIDEKKL